MKETIWTYLESKGFDVKPRDEKKVVHLALESEKLNKAQKSRMEEPGLLSKKLDGVYSMVTRVGGEVRHWGRSGKAQSNTQELDRRMEEARFLLDPDVDWVFISEITSDSPLADLSAYLNPNRKNPGFVPENVQDNLHDIISLKDFIEGQCSITKYIRTSFLERAFPLKTLSPNIGLLTQSKGTLAMAQSAAKAYIKEGGEGYIYSQAGAPWVAGARNESIIKIKEKLSFDCTVVGYTTGFSGGKYEGLIGSIMVYFYAFGKPGGETFEIPLSGMKDEQRQQWMINPEAIIGKVVKVDAKSYTAYGNLREPRFKEIREDKPSDFPVEFTGERTYRSMKGGQRVIYTYRPKI